MAATIITAGDSVNQAASYSGGNDSTLVLQTGPNGAKVNAQSIGADGTTTLLKAPVNAAAPCFSAYSTVAQSIPNAAFTKVSLQTKEFDTTTAFDATTNYRYTPLVAGYYQVYGSCGCNTPNNITAIYKNGSIYKRGVWSAGTSQVSNVACLVYLNGSTDYIEMFAYQSAGSAQNTNASADQVYLQAALISRSA